MGGKYNERKDGGFCFRDNMCCTKSSEWGGETCACVCRMTDCQSVPPLFLPHHHPQGPAPVQLHLVSPGSHGQLSVLQRARLVLSQSFCACPFLCLPLQTSLLGWILFTSSQYCLLSGSFYRKNLQSLFTSLLCFCLCIDINTFSEIMLFVYLLHKGRSLVCSQRFPIMLTGAWHVEAAWQIFAE